MRYIFVLFTLMQCIYAFTFVYNEDGTNYICKTTPALGHTNKNNYLLINRPNTLTENELDYNNTKYNFTCTTNNTYINFKCLNYYSTSVQVTYTDSYIYPLTETKTIYINPTQLDYCSNTKYKSCAFANGAFLCSSANFCPAGEYYNTTKEQCVAQCPSGTQLDELAAKKCTSDNFVTYEMCNPNDGNITITCETCTKVITDLKNYCKNTFNTGINPHAKITCTYNNAGDLNVSFTSFTPNLCDINDTNNTQEYNNTKLDINSTKENNNTKKNINATNTNFNNNTENNSNNTNSNTFNTSNKNINNNTNNNTNNCPNPCSLITNPVLGLTTKQVGSCIYITNPTYLNDKNQTCVLEYHYNNEGECVPGCTETNTSKENNNTKINTTNVANTLKSSTNVIQNLINSIQVNTFNNTLTAPQCTDYVYVKIYNNSYKFPNLLCKIVELIQQYPNIFKLFREVLIGIAAILGYLTIFTRS